MDKSFEGLLFSVVVHAVLVWILFFGHFSPPVSVTNNATEIVLIEKPDKKSQTFVTETQKEPKLEDLKDTADFLSQLTKRVKKQMRAAKSGPTINARPQPRLPNPNPSKHVGANQGQRESEEDGVGLQKPGGSQAMRTIAIGQSSLAEYIPSVQEGAFTSLNTDQFTYYTFFARMNEQVRNRWVGMIRNYVGGLDNRTLENLSRRERQTIIEIILGPEGQFNNAVVHSSSGDQQLDSIPSEAFQTAAPFPNPPHGMIEQDGFIHLKYAFMLQFRPPSFGPATN